MKVLKSVSKWVCSRVLDSQGDIVCTIVPEGQIFKADFSHCVALLVVWLLVFQRSFGNGIGD
jgi:hypothetical protein